MASDIKVAKAFQATVSKEDKTPKTFVNKAGQTLFVWKVQFEGRSDWINVNKQEGNEIKPGDVMYGNIVEEQAPWGTVHAFKGEQRPLDAPAPQSDPGTPSNSLEDKVDRILQLVEKLNGERDDALAAFNDSATSVDDLNI